MGPTTWDAHPELQRWDFDWPEEPVPGGSARFLLARRASELAEARRRHPSWTPEMETARALSGRPEDRILAAELNRLFGLAAS